jgi:hypothetical protein
MNHVEGMECIVKNVPQRKHAVLGNMTAIKALGYFVPTLLLALGKGNMYQ